MLQGQALRACFLRVSYCTKVLSEVEASHSVDYLVGVVRYDPKFVSLAPQLGKDEVCLREYAQPFLYIKKSKIYSVQQVSFTTVDAESVQQLDVIQVPELLHPTFEVIHFRIVDSINTFHRSEKLVWVNVDSDFGRIC